MWCKIILFCLILLYTNVSSTNISLLKFEHQDYNDLKSEDSIQINTTETSVEKESLNSYEKEEDRAFEAIETDNYNKDEELNLQFYNMLDIDFRSGTKDTQFQKARKFTPPQFINDFYHSRADKNNHVMPYDSQKIYALLENDISVQCLFKFNINGLQEDDDIQEAELHIYRIENDMEELRVKVPYFLLRVYQVMPLGEDVLSLNPDVHRLLNVHYIPAYATGWQVFKVKKAVESWRNGSSPNLGLLVTATTILGEPVDVMFARKGIQGDTYQPSLTVFTKNPREVTHKISRRSIKPMKDDKNSIKNNLVTKPNNPITNSSNCQVLPFVVDFKYLGFDFIIGPKTFDMKMCSGDCYFPPLNGTRWNLTTKALLQSMIHKLDDKIIGSPHCVATQLSSLSILYFDLYDNVVYTDLPDVIVQKCGCR